MDDVTQLALWGGHECTVSRIGDRYSDQTMRSGHHARAGDIARFAGLGVSALRYPVLWERDDPGFAWAAERLDAMRGLGIRPIVGLVHHGSGPPHTDLLADDFASGVAGHAAAVAARFPWVTDWTPINEPLTTARFACLYGLWYPHAHSEAACWRALLNQIDATRAAMRAIRAVNPQARLIQTDDLGRATGTPRLAAQVDFENARRWLGWDLLCGRVVPGHVLWERLAGHGLAGRLAAIADDPCPPAIIGINHYLSSNRYLTHERSRHPGLRTAGDGAPCINIETVRVGDDSAGLGALLAEAWDRYGIPIAVTECHNGSHRDEQLRWFHQCWRDAQAARAAGVDVVAVTAWSLLGAHDWNSLLTRDDGHYEPGVFDIRSDPPRPTAMARLLPALARGAPPPLRHVVEAPGWWHRADRFLPGYGGDAPLAPVAGPPILVTGRTGTLAQALGQACRSRALAHVLTGRDRLAVDRAGDAGPLLDALKPWAVINCAGIVDIDAAEHDRARTMLVNGVGPGELARLCAERGIAFVQISSDQVFGGDAGAPYAEDAATGAVNAYGAAKALAEAAVLGVHPGALVVRTAAFFSPHDRHNFAVHVADRLATGATVSVAADEFVSPTYVPDLVHALLDLLIDGEAGIWHLTNAGGLSWAGFAAALAQAYGHDATLVRPVVSVAPGRLAPRQADVRLAPRAGDVRLVSGRGQILPPLASAIARFAASYFSMAAPALVAAE